MSSPLAFATVVSPLRSFWSLCGAELTPTQESGKPSTASEAGCHLQLKHLPRSVPLSVLASEYEDGIPIPSAGVEVPRARALARLEAPHPAGPCRSPLCAASFRRFRLVCVERVFSLPTMESGVRASSERAFPMCVPIITCISLGSPLLETQAPWGSARACGWRSIGPLPR